MADQINIYNPTTKKFGYQVEGSTIPAGWIAVNAPKTDSPNPHDAPGYDPTADPTSSVRRYSGAGILGESPYDKAATEYFANQDRSQPDEAKIRSDALAAVQSQIDNIKNTYAGLLASEKTSGQDRLGRTRAVNARSGLLGSDFGGARLARTEDYNAEKEKAIQNEQALKIDEILAGVNKDAEEKIRLEKERVDKNTEQYLSYLKDSGERAKDQIKQLASAGFTPDKLTDSEYNHLLESTGYTEDQLKSEFILNKPKKDIVFQQAIGSSYLVASRDPLTGEIKSETIKLPFDIPPNYKTEKLENGQLIFYPDKFDPNKDAKSQIFTYGTQTSPTTKPQASGSLTYTQADIADGAKILESSKGADGYVDPDLYRQMYQEWIKSGGLPQDFTKNYPPANYVNPSNTSLPQNLRSKDLFDTAGGGA